MSDEVEYGPDGDSMNDSGTSPSWKDDWAPWIKKAGIGLGAIAAVTLLWTGAGRLWRAAGPQDIRVSLYGSGVGQLSRGGRLVLGPVIVGEVEQVESESGDDVARVRIDRDYVAQIPRSSEFEVDSLNDWLPGNVGVRIHATSRSDEPPLTNGARIKTVERLSPPAIPKNFCLLVASCSVAVVVLLAIVWRIGKALSSLVLFVGGIAVIGAVLAYLNGIISTP